MTGLGKVPPGLMRAVGSEVLWGLALSALVVDRLTGSMTVVFPLVNGALTWEVLPVCQWCQRAHDPAEGCQRTPADMRRLHGDHGTGSERAVGER